MTDNRLPLSARAAQAAANTRQPDPFIPGVSKKVLALCNRRTADILALQQHRHGKDARHTAPLAKSLPYFRAGLPHALMAGRSPFSWAVDTCLELARNPRRVDAECGRLGPKLPTSTALGRLLDLTAAEREAVPCYSLRAVDQAGDRQMRLATKRRELDVRKVKRAQLGKGERRARTAEVMRLYARLYGSRRSFMRKTTAADRTALAEMAHSDPAQAPCEVGTNRGGDRLRVTPSLPPDLCHQGARGGLALEAQPPPPQGGPDYGQAGRVVAYTPRAPYARPVAGPGVGKAIILRLIAQTLRPEQ